MARNRFHSRHPSSRVCIEQASEWDARRRSTTSQARGESFFLGFSPIPYRKFLGRRRASLENRRCHRAGDRRHTKKGVTDVISRQFRLSNVIGRLVLEMHAADSNILWKKKKKNENCRHLFFLIFYCFIKNRSCSCKSR